MGPTANRGVDGQHMIRGFCNPDIRNKLKDSPHLKDLADPRRQSVFFILCLKAHSKKETRVAIAS